MGDSVDWAFEDSKRHPVDKDYDVGKQLGEGKFSIVHYAKHKTTGETVAIKCIDRENTNPDELVHEAMLMQLVDEHPGIVKIKDVYEDLHSFYLVMEYVSGGELFDKIVETEFYSEKEAAGIIRQICSIVKFIHEKGVVHRDLKPENLLYVDSSLSELKLCDFGLADTIEPDELLTAIVGSTTYMAPEVAKGEGYDMSVDLYSIGVIMYILLCGYPPFEPEAGIIDLEFPKKEWAGISKSAIDLISKLLSKNPSDRLTAVEMLEHPWVKGEDAAKKKLVGTIKTMKQYNVARKTGETMRKKDEVTKATVFNLFDQPPASATPVATTPLATTTATMDDNDPKKKKKAEKAAKKEQKKKEKENKKSKSGKKAPVQVVEEKHVSTVSFGEIPPTKAESKAALNQSTSSNVNIEELKKSYYKQIKDLTKELENERKKVKTLEAQVVELQKKTKDNGRKKK